MIILNTCNDVKVQYNDSEPRKLFSMRTLNKEEAPELILFDDVLVDEKSAILLREFPFEWLESEDRSQIYAVRVDAEKEVCRDFLMKLLSNGEILLDDK